MTNTIYSIPFENSLTKKQVVSFYVFCTGFLIYSLGLLLSSAEYVNYVICQAGEAIGVLLMIPASIMLLQFKIEAAYLRITFTLYFTWLIIVMIRGISIPVSYDFVKTFFFSGGGNSGLIYFAPLVLFFPKQFSFYKRMFVAIIGFGIIYLILNAIFAKDLLFRGQNPVGQSLVENLSKLSLPIGFILFTYTLHNYKKNLVAIFVLLVTLLFTIIRARRGLIFITSSIIVCSYLIYTYHSKKKIFVFYLTFLAIILGMLYASNIYDINKNRFFTFLAQRGVEDTRSNVELFFYDDMKTNDWIAGRGMLGEYFCPDIEEGQETNFRSVIETGYLQLILKGGIISLGLLVLITVPAFVKGLFFSKNLFSKAAGIWILLFLLNLYPQNAVSFTFSYFLVWISIGICYSKRIRNMSNEEIKGQIWSANNL